ncbi:MAG: hypothetical protein ACKOWF_05820, partial [Chloroflexota bacterium]
MLRPSLMLSRRAVLAASGLAMLSARAPGLSGVARADDAAPAGWVAFRSWTLKDDADRAALVTLTGEAFVPLLRGLDGFIGYFVIEPSPLEWLSITVWRDEAASAAALPAIRGWVDANVAASVAAGPVGFEGAVDIAAFDDSLAGPAPAPPVPAPEAGWVGARTYRRTPDPARA